ncbi:MAG: type IV pili methyl-accepting chemotaxis transducer N-terminal domain-containing protein, partial [Hydrogenophaga sp.]|nr:type IV pili methyl-accepting chemotaxis transducer N-terminal domain-containing protein [Hydrogenophaga sp.]
MAMLDRFQGLFRKQGADEPDLSHVTDQEMAELAAARLAPDRSDDLAENRLAAEDVDVSSGAGLVSLPLLGRKTAEQHRRNLGTLLVFALVLLVAVIFFVLSQTEKISQQVAASGQALMQSQRLAKSVSQALVGSPAAFPEVRESSEVLSRNMRGFKEGDSELSIDALGAAYTDQLTELTPRIDAAMSNATTVLAQQSILTQVGDSLRSINRQSSDLLEIAETISALKLERNAPAADISAAGQLVMLTQRIGKSANEFLTLEGVSPEAVFLLGKDLNTFKEIAEALLNGSDELRLKATNDPQIRERLEALLKLYDQTRTEAAAILGNLQGLASAREAQASIVADSEPLRIGLQKLQSDLSARAGLGGRELAALLASALFALLCGAGLAFVQLQESRQRQLMAENQRLTAESQEQDAKRVNDANQAAILRLMNELQTVAEGDLTQEATVT